MYLAREIPGLIFGVAVYLGGGVPGAAGLDQEKLLGAATLCASDAEFAENRAEKKPVTICVSTVFDTQKNLDYFNKVFQECQKHQSLLLPPVPRLW